MNDRTYQRWLRRTLACAVLVAGAAWSCFALVENRQRAWVEEAQQSTVPFYPAAYSGAVENLFAGSH